MNKSLSMQSRVQLARGFSLIELMVAITLGLMILATVTSMFMGQLRSRNDLEKSNQMIDNGRYAMDILGEEIKLSGFYGSFDPSSVSTPASLPDLCSVDKTVLSAAVPLHLQALNNETLTSSISTPPSCLSDFSLKAGSDVLLTRRADTQAPVAQAAAVSGTMYLQASLCQYDVDAYRVDNEPANFQLRQKACTPISTTPYADLRRYLTHLYFIDRNNEESDGIPTLKRLELDTDGNWLTVPLVEGIEFMQFEYGIDNNNDGAADSYVSCATCTASDWRNVVSVKVTIIARSLEPVQGYIDNKTYSLGLAGSYTPGSSDRYKRHLYTQVVRLVNPSSRREVP